MQFFALFCAILGVVGAQHPSPCPGVFEYTHVGPTEPGKWTGELTLDSEFPLAGVWIRLNLDRKVDEIKAEFGEVVLREPKSHLIKSKDYNLVPGTPLKIPIEVKFPENEPVPNVVSVRLNARTVCPATTPETLATKCPGVFTYVKDKEDEFRWHGIVTLSSEFELQGVWARIVLDNPAELLGNEFGEIRTEDNISYLISNRNHTLSPGHPVKLAFWVKYAPDGPVPNIHSVRLNGRTVCGQIISEDNNQFAHRVPAHPAKHRHAPRPIFPPFNPTTAPTPTIVTSQPTTPSVVASPMATLPLVTSLPSNVNTSGNQLISCGTVEPQKTNLITFGETAQSAQWPWHGAIYLIKTKAVDYICGMSLITEQHALTAAHCLVESISTKKTRDPKTLVLFFGLLNRTDFNAASVQSPTVNSIIVHDEYKVSENDIAVIKFENKVRFTDFVRPVCLWEGDTDQRFVVNQTGTVVGFGVTQNGAISQELMYANILVVDTPTCIFSHRDFYSKYTSLNTFCAGNLTQSAVCNGDSGGAMIFRRDGSDVWQVRGIVSTAVRNVDTGLCDYNYYAIFTDAAKFTAWVEMQIAR